jgi:hypothetical protein
MSVKRHVGLSGLPGSADTGPSGMRGRRLVGSGYRQPGFGFYNRWGSMRATIGR